MASGWVSMVDPLFGFDRDNAGSWCGPPRAGPGSAVSAWSDARHAGAAPTCHGSDRLACLSTVPRTTKPAATPIASLMMR